MFQLRLYIDQTKQQLRGDLMSTELIKDVGVTDLLTHLSCPRLSDYLTLS